MKTKLILLLMSSLFFLACKKEENLHFAPHISINKITHIIDDKEFVKKSEIAFVEEGKDLMIDFEIISSENLQQINAYSTIDNVVDFSEFPDGLYGEHYKRNFDSEKKDNFTINAKDIYNSFTISILAHDKYQLATALNISINVVKLSAIFSNHALNKNEYFSIHTQKSHSSNDTLEKNHLEFLFDGKTLSSPNLKDGITTYFIETESDLNATELAYFSVPTDSTSINISTNKKYIFSSSNNKKGIITIQQIENDKLVFDFVELYTLK